MSAANDNFEIAKADEMLRQSEMMAAELRDAFAKTKERGSAIFGWMLTIEMSAAGFGAARPEDIPLILPIIAWCFLISCLAILVSRPVGMKPYWFSSTDLEDIVKKFGVCSEAHLKTCLSYEIENTVAENLKSHRRLQIALRLAWLAITLCPIVLFAVMSFAR